MTGKFLPEAGKYIERFIFRVYFFFMADEGVEIGSGLDFRSSSAGKKTSFTGVLKGSFFGFSA